MRALVALVCFVSLWAAAFGQAASARQLLSARDDSAFMNLWFELPVHEKQALGGDRFIKQTLGDRQRTLRAYLKDTKWRDSAATTQVKDARAEAKRIIVPPAYRPRELNPAERSSNWLADALNRSGEVIAKVLERIFEFLRKLLPQGGGIAGGGGALAGVIPIVQLIVILAAIALIIFALRFVTIRRRVARVGDGLLSEEEVALPADEWLKRADQLAMAGEHRQAVRCLYLACLVRFDEYGIIPLRREETNWEHLRRFEKSRTRPTDLNFRDATSKFDIIWYGERTQGMEDVAWFRSQYETVMRSIRQRRSA